MERALIAISVLAVSASVSAAPTPDLIIPSEGIKTLSPGMYEFNALTIQPRGKLILKDSVTIACKSLTAEDGASIEYKPNGDPATQANIFIDTLDASGLHFLYISANGQDGKSQPGQARTGDPGRDASRPGHSLKYPGGRSADAGKPGTTGVSGQKGTHAANVKLHLPNVKHGSLIRIHTNGGNGGDGQNGGNGGKGGNGAAMHPAAKGGAGGRGGMGGNGGNAGRIIVYLVVPDTATEPEKQATMRAVRIETANSGGNPGRQGVGGSGGPGGHGAAFGGDGSSGGEGNRGQGADSATAGADSGSLPTDRWTAIDVITAGEHAREYARTLDEIRSRLQKR